MLTRALHVGTGFPFTIECPFRPKPGGRQPLAILIHRPLVLFDSGLITIVFVAIDVMVIIIVIRAAMNV